MKSRVIIFDSTNQLANLDVSFQFFFYFSDKGLIRRFTGFYLSAWKFPLALKFTITSSCSKCLLNGWL